MAACPKCRAPLGTPLVCEKCGGLLEPVARATPFEILGLEPAFALDPSALRARVLALSRRVHPDYFAAGEPELRARAERNTAELNVAHQVLADELRRADWLVKHLGGPGEDEERSMPSEFLHEVLEWNEAIEAARAHGPSAQAELDELARRLSAERTATLKKIGALLTPLPARSSSVLAEIRKHLNAARYMDRALREIAELKLVQASSPR
jgi:molecular chaperone HscB